MDIPVDGHYSIRHRVTRITWYIGVKACFEIYIPLKEALNTSPTYEKIAAHALNTSEIKE
jgi:hypothetical protein